MLVSAQKAVLWRLFSCQWPVWTFTHPLWRDRPTDVHRIVVFLSQRCALTFASFVTWQRSLPVLGGPRSPAGVFAPTVLALAFTRRRSLVLCLVLSFRLLVFVLEPLSAALAFEPDWLSSSRTRLAVCGPCPVPRQRISSVRQTPRLQRPAPHRDPRHLVTRRSRSQS